MADPKELSEPKTISPSAAPVRAKVPVVASNVLCALTVAEVNAAVPYETFVIAGPADPPISRDPTVTSPVLLIVVEAIVPIVFVPVEDVKPVAKVVTPFTVGIVAVLIVAVLIVAVPIVAVPVVAEMLELKVAAPVTARLEAKVVAPTELSVPLELTPRVEICSADTDDSSPVAIAVSVLVKGVLPDTFNN